ncbi:hypothetical protein ACHAWT_009221 [Skeletonema menzelii]
MSNLNSENNNPDGGQGAITDATQLVYSWLPHSKALGASSTVAIRVRNASLSDARQPNRSSSVYPSAASINDEKKYNGEDDEIDESARNNFNLLLYAPECRVEASIYGYGLPLQAAPVSTKYAPLLPYNHNGNYHDANLTSQCGKDWSTVTFDSMISLPVRWRDLTRDACLTLNIYCDGDVSNHDGDVNDGNGPSERKVWGTTLSLFDENGKLRSGLYKLKLYPNTLADGGMGYQSKDETNKEDVVPIETFLEGGATPGIVRSQDNNSTSSKWLDERKLDKDQDDPKWKASLILHELDRLETSTSSSNAGGANLGVGTAKSQYTTTSSVPWLDALTRERCMDILNGDDDDEYSYTSSTSTTSTDQRRKETQRSNTRLKQEKLPSPTSSHHNSPYLIVELPTPPIPVLHEEPFYPTTTYINANELIKFHSKFRSDDEESGLAVRISPMALDAPTTDTPQSFLYPLVQILDHEPPLTDENDNVQDNPAQDKYRILAHDLIRGLVDPGLKPDRSQRARLERIIGSPSHHLSTEEKDLLWRFRFSLVDNRRALPKFLEAVDWSVESEVVQTVELLDQWRKRSPIEVTDALKLLGRNVAFQTSLVRSYAIDTLSKSSDEELRLYLLQLVQALKYEEDVSGGTSGGNDAYAFSENKPAGVTSLSTFLIERASRNVDLANFLFSFLRVELDNPIYEVRYREVFSLFQVKLSSVRVKNGSITHSKDTADTLSLWELLNQQEKFISGIMDCQRDSLSARGKKDAKESHLREALESGGFHNIQHAVPLPSAPHIFVKGVNPKSVKMFKSALYPAVVDFVVDRVKTADGKDAKHFPTTYKVMIKTGDDLRQDQLVIMMIQLMDRLLKRGTLDLCLKPYSILAMPRSSGLLEFVEKSIPVSQILSSNNNSIMEFFKSVAPQEGARYSIKPDVLQTYMRSCAGYCVLTYLLGVGDRHLDNILIQPSGHFFHIDFGFIFGRDPKPLPPAFRLTKEMVDGMGGTDSKEYKQFCSLACQAYNTLRKSAGLVLNLLHLMSDAGIEDLSNHPIGDAIEVISKVEERFRLDLTDEQAELFFIGLINDSQAALAPRVMEKFHQFSVAMR